MTTKSPKDGATCAVCGKGFTDEEWENRHWAHRPGCPHQGELESQCDCGDDDGNVTHEDHCPNCISIHLKQHLPRDLYGNIYTITAEHVMNVFSEFMRRNPDLVEKIDRLDMFRLAVEIQDYIGSVGLIDYIETAVSEAIRDRIAHEVEDEND
jgi:hypothetical protein